MYTIDNYFQSFVKTLLFLAPEKARDSKDIWDAEEVPEGAEFEDDSDPRPQPE